MSEIRILNTREWQVVDVDKIRKDFAKELAEDCEDIEDVREVVRVAWDSGVREPYFELWDEGWEYT